MTSRQRQAALRARRRSQGLVRVEVWVPEGDKWAVRAHAEELCYEAERKAKEAE